MNWRRLRYRVLSLLPHNRIGDFLHGAPYFIRAHGRLPRKNRRLISDYLFWLKNSTEIEDNVRQFTSDKYHMKLFVSAILGAKYVPETYQVIESPGELDSLCVPNAAVVKSTHLQGQVKFLAAGEQLSEPDREELKRSFKRSLYWEHREKNYKNLKPKVIVEEALGSPETLYDYKFFCYMGEPRFITVDQDRHTRHIRNIYTIQWERIPYWYELPLGRWEDKPEQLNEMLRVARKLSSFFESARIDLYIANGQVYVGEITHCPASGAGCYQNREAEEYISRIFFGDSDD